MITVSEDNYLISVHFSRNVNPEPETLYERLANKLVEKGYLQYEGYGYFLTKKGEDRVLFILGELE